MAFSHRIRHTAAQICAVLASGSLLIAACGDTKNEKDTGAQSGDGSASDALVCAWSPDLDPPTERGACEAARTRLRCELSDGSVASCASDGVTGCSGPDGKPIAVSACKKECRGDEYTVRCGAAGPSNIQAAPEGCRGLGALPAGMVLYCCPCSNE